MRLVDRSDFRLPVVIATSISRMLRRPVETALGAAIAMVHQPHVLGWSSIVNSLFQGIEHEARMCRGADPPANDLPGIGINDESDIDEPLPGGDIGKVADPEHVRPGHPELPVHLVQRARCRSVRDRRLVRLAPDNALNAHTLHQPCHRASGDIEALAAQLPPDLPDAVDPPVLFEYPQDLGAQGRVSTCPIRQPRWFSPPRQMVIVGGRGDRQNLADRLDPVRIPMRVDERHHHFDRRSSSAIAK